MNSRLLALFAAAVVFSAAFTPVLAAVSINTTRLVYPANEREITLQMNNVGSEPALMQMWIDRGNQKSKPQNADAPFIITPPLFRLDAGRGQSVRIIFTGEKLPADRESLFWFNAMEVPPLTEGAGNNMQIAVRSRMKLFYRPAALTADAASAPQKISWTIKASGAGGVLSAHNPTPYFVTFGKLDVANKGKVYRAGSAMIAPFSSSDFPLRDMKSPSGKSVLTYQSIGDFGMNAECRVAVR